MYIANGKTPKATNIYGLSNKTIIFWMLILVDLMHLK
jgi:hypothetical protein